MQKVFAKWAKTNIVIALNKRNQEKQKTKRQETK